MSNFRLIKKSKVSQARLSELETSHGTIQGPFFMPIATRGVLKNLTPDELKNLEAQIILGNTYHLMLRPGIEIIKKAGGLHKFMGWDGPILTDSGGYQAFSLNRTYERKYYLNNFGARIKRTILQYLENPLNHRRKNTQTNLNFEIQNNIKIIDKGVIFKSEIDGQKIFLSPEKAIELQLALGSDIMMVLDECVPYPCNYEYTKQAMKRTTEWAKKSSVALKNLSLKSTVFGIIQGSIYKNLREQSAKEITALDFDGYAIGGVAVGEPREKIWKVVDWVVPFLPENKPRYLMGLGRPEEIVQAVKMGIDMFDCVIPTRNARHGTVYKFKSEIRKMKFIENNKIQNSKFNSDFIFHNSSFYEILRITNEKFKNDFTPIDPTCPCYACQHYSRAYLRHLFILDEPLALRLTTIHNLAFYLGLMKKIREAIQRDSSKKGM